MLELERNRMEEMVRRLNEASEAYYGGRDEIMSNFEWDALFYELTRLEEETGVVLPDSPTQKANKASIFSTRPELTTERKSINTTEGFSCPNCGNSDPSLLHDDGDTIFCSKCFLDTRKDTGELDLITCPFCGYPRRRRAFACSVCGSSLGQTPGPSKEDYDELTPGLTEWEKRSASDPKFAYIVGKRKSWEDLQHLNKIEELLNNTYWIIDIFPMQVPKDSPGQFFSVEKYILEKQLAEIKQKHINLILKLNCYVELSVDGEVNPAPDQIVDTIRKRHVYIMMGNSMILSEPDDTHMTLFNPDEQLLELVKTLASSEGLFVWKGSET